MIITISVSALLGVTVVGASVLYFGLWRRHRRLRTQYETLRQDFLLIPESKLDGAEFGAESVSSASLQIVSLHTATPTPRPGAFLARETQSLRTSIQADQDELQKNVLSSDSVYVERVVNFVYAWRLACSEKFLDLSVFRYSTRTYSDGLFNESRFNGKSSHWPVEAALDQLTKAVEIAFLGSDFVEYYHGTILKFWLPYLTKYRVDNAGIVRIIPYQILTEVGYFDWVERAQVKSILQAILADIYGYSLKAEEGEVVFKNPYDTMSIEAFVEITKLLLHCSPAPNVRMFLSDLSEKCCSKYSRYNQEILEDPKEFMAGMLYPYHLYQEPKEDTTEYDLSLAAPPLRKLLSYTPPARYHEQFLRQVAVHH